MRGPGRYARGRPLQLFPRGGRLVGGWRRRRGALTSECRGAAVPAIGIAHPAGGHTDRTVGLDRYPSARIPPGDALAGRGVRQEPLGDVDERLATGADVPGLRLWLRDAGQDRTDFSTRGPLPDVVGL